MHKYCYNKYMKAKTKIGLTFLTAITFVLIAYLYVSGNFNDIKPVIPNNNNPTEVEKIKEDGYYTSKEDVALYIHTYNKLPYNYITKSEANKLGWEANKGNLWDVTDKYLIGGDKFNNYEGLLPKKKGRQYYECDIDYEGGHRNAKRIVFSDDGLIYYTDDHYKSFELLYGEEE